MAKVVRSANLLHSIREPIMNDHVKPVRIARPARSRKVNVEVGTGAIAPKIAIHRYKAKPPVKVEVGTGAIAPKVALHRRRSFSR
jgi:hypothetical protein